MYLCMYINSHSFYSSQFHNHLFITTGPIHLIRCLLPSASSAPSPTYSLACAHQASL